MAKTEKDPNAVTKTEPGKLAECLTRQLTGTCGCEFRTTRAKLRAEIEAIRACLPDERQLASLEIASTLRMLEARPELENTCDTDALARASATKGVRS
jgi:hypothetical protein